jgi:hypothetical protein
MYRMGIITMLCPPETGIDRDRCVKLALIHDMAEALVGDITPPDNVPKGRPNELPIACSAPLIFFVAQMRSLSASWSP